LLSSLNISSHQLQQPLLFPEIDRDSYLQMLWNSVVFTDVVKRWRVRSPDGIGNLATYLLTNFSREYSLGRLTRIANCKSKVTVEKYIGYLQEAFLFFSVPRFSYKLRVQTFSNRKIYCIDSGFITTCSQRFSPDIGRLAENSVAVAWHKKVVENACRVSYWKDESQWEVDFVVSQNSNITHLMQVCWDISDPETEKRAIRALIRTSQALECDRLIILTGGEGEASIQNHSWHGATREILIIPLWQWLSQDDPLTADVTLSADVS